MDFSFFSSKKRGGEGWAPSITPASQRPLGRGADGLGEKPPPPEILNPPEFPKGTFPLLAVLGIQSGRGLLAKTPRSERYRLRVPLASFYCPPQNSGAWFGGWRVGEELGSPPTKSRKRGEAWGEGTHFLFITCSMLDAALHELSSSFCPHSPVLFSR